MRMWNFLNDGGVTMAMLVIAMLLLWGALGYRITVLRRGSRESLGTLITRVRAGGNLNESGIITRAVAISVALARTRHPSILRDTLETVFFEKFDAEMMRFSVLVRSLVVIAPLLGLLGTVSGMMETFRSLDGDGFFAQAGGMAAGIAEALVATQLGLAVAIPGLLLGRTIQRREERIRNELLQLREAICACAD
jgi:biopolymer transport protein ExbB